MPAGIFAEPSGGETLFPGDMIGFGKSLARRRDLICPRLLLACKPADFAPHGKHRSPILIAEREGKRLQVHVRKGY